jgi:hypothetical protein
MPPKETQAEDAEEREEKEEQSYHVNLWGFT